MIVVLDFGSQYTRLIARRVRESRVYCELLPHTASWNEIEAHQPVGIILSGGPASVYERGSPTCPPEVFKCGIPVLGICYGLQLIALEFGGSIEPADSPEYGQATVRVTQHDAVLDGLPEEFLAWMSHGDRVAKLPPSFHSVGQTENSQYAAVSNGAGIVGLQFHPEVAHTPMGANILANFVFNMCRETPSWTPASIVADSVERIRRQVGAERVLCALSGGVDSTVAATLLTRALPGQVACVFVDTGLLRVNEAPQLMEAFRHSVPVQVIRVDAAARFLARLSGLTDPEEKRHAIGHEFIRVFSDEARKLGDVAFLAQGTLYPDVIESASPDMHGAAKIKTHHNVGGLPPDLEFQLVEPLRDLFKDEVREVGIELGLPEAIVRRQPFPGPGLAVRIIGEVTQDRLEILRQADDIVDREVRAAGWYEQLWQSFAVLTPVQTVGVMGDGRTYSNVVAIRAVTSEDAMTADWARLPHELLASIANRIVNEVAEVNRVVYDITSKPPATIEWE